MNEKNNENKKHKFYDSTVYYLTFMICKINVRIYSMNEV